MLFLKKRAFLEFPVASLSLSRFSLTLTEALRVRERERERLFFAMAFFCFVVVVFVENEEGKMFLSLVSFELKNNRAKKNRRRPPSQPVFRKKKSLLLPSEPFSSRQFHPPSEAHAAMGILDRYERGKRVFFIKTATQGGGE